MLPSATASDPSKSCLENANDFMRFYFRAVALPGEPTDRPVKVMDEAPKIARALPAPAATRLLSDGRGVTLKRLCEAISVSFNQWAGTTPSRTF